MVILFFVSNWRTATAVIVLLILAMLVTILGTIDVAGGSALVRARPPYEGARPPTAHEYPTTLFASVLQMFASSLASEIQPLLSQAVISGGVLPIMVTARQLLEA